LSRYVSRKAKFLRYITGSIAVLLLAVGVLYFHGYAKPPATWWYPFINSLFSDYYTTGPFAMTSNTREDNPIWEDLAAFNQAQSRLTYAMSRGEPAAKVAWLFAEAEWMDSPGAIGGSPNPNVKETAMSKALVAAGLSAPNPLLC
jgi:hypothetical protein